MACDTCAERRRKARETRQQVAAGTGWTRPPEPPTATEEENR